MSLGSGLFTKPTANKPHLVKNRSDGLSGEVGKLRADLLAELTPLAAVAVEEWTNPPTATISLIKTDFAVSLAAVILRGADFNGTVGAATFVAPRTVCVHQAPGAYYTAANITVKGLDAQGRAITDTLLLQATGDVAVGNTVGGVKFFAKITEIDIPAQANVLGMLSFGLGFSTATAGGTATKKMGLARPPKARTGALFILQEIVDGGVVTSGSFTAAATDAPYGSYTPSAAPNGVHDYSVKYEYDATA